jgi:formylglycine-generating enzyme required for sulfatase activity
LAYVAWLTEQTGKQWRLPSEAEWEYAARAGSIDRYPTDTSLPMKLASKDTPSTKPASVGRYPPNGFGLFDMRGGVSEIAADCWEPAPARLRGDGYATGRGDCSLRALRDGAWFEAVETTGVSARRPIRVDERRHGVGIRVAREP